MTCDTDPGDPVEMLVLLRGHPKACSNTLWNRKCVLGAEEAAEGEHGSLLGEQIGGGSCQMHDSRCSHLQLILSSITIKPYFSAVDMLVD